MSTYATTWSTALPSTSTGRPARAAADDFAAAASAPPCAASTVAIRPAGKAGNAMIGGGVVGKRLSSWLIRDPLLLLMLSC